MNKELIKLKKAYLSLEPPRDLLEHGWAVLEKEFEQKDSFSFVPRFVSLPLFSILLFLLIGTGIVYASQNSLPGEPLYPIKRLSEKAIIAVSADKTSQIDKREKEIVGLLEEPHEEGRVKEAVAAYEETVKETKREIEKEKKKEQKDAFEKKLENHEKEFLNTIEKRPSAKEELKGAVEATQKGRNKN